MRIEGNQAAASAGLGASCGGMGAPSIPPPAFGDLETALAFAIDEVAATQTESAMATAGTAKVRRDEALEEARRAARRARRNRRRARRWKKVATVAKAIGTVAAVSGAVASMAATGGASLVAVAALSAAGLSITSEVMRGAGANEKATMGVSIAGSVVGIASGVGALATAQCVEAGAEATEKGIDMALAVGVGAAATQSAASGTEGAGTIGGGVLEARSVEQDATAEGSNIEAERQGDAAEETIDFVEMAEELRARAFEVIGSMLESKRAVDQAITGRLA